jgi:hypothetical protein
MPGSVMMSCNAGMQQPNSTTGLKVFIKPSRMQYKMLYQYLKGVRMFNFSANHLQWRSTNSNLRYNVHVLKDADTKRCYKVYDFMKKWQFEKLRQYNVSGKVNSADKIYLVLETVKEK